jgi:hypothetical protein
LVPSFPPPQPQAAGAPQRWSPRSSSNTWEDISCR